LEGSAVFDDATSLRFGSRLVRDPNHESVERRQFEGCPQEQLVVSSVEAHGGLVLYATRVERWASVYVGRRRVVLVARAVEPALHMRETRRVGKIRRDFVQFE